MTNNCQRGRSQESFRDFKHMITHSGGNVE